MLRTHQEMLSELIAAPDGMITVDPSDFPKKGKESVGVSRQYCGALGKVENCQSGVFVGYTSEKGYGLLNCRLYMPKSWFSDEQEKRRAANLVPENLVF
ncbi:MAG: transposase [Desulfobacterales bacterium]|nr:transposase [Desulfobacterales bacterium]